MARMGDGAEEARGKVIVGAEAAACSTGSSSSSRIRGSRERERS